MRDHITGWLFVAAQGAILVALILIPESDAWPTPSWVHRVATILIFGGFALVGVASLRLGPGLTPTPMPSSMGRLTTTGLYRWMRHPIYTGVLTIVTGMTLQSGSWTSLAVGVSAFGFFSVKARWEEARLAERYDGYREYVRRTPRFFPHPLRTPLSASNTQPRKDDLESP